MNSAASLATALPVGRIARYVWVGAAYTVPAAVVWALLGLVLNALPLSQAALVLAALYAAYFGLVEANEKHGLPAPGSTWQVPTSFVISVAPWRKVLVWGSLLGPGFATRNPYASFGLLPIAVAAMGSISTGIAVGAAIGIAHGGGRAFAMLRDAKSIDAADHLESMVRSMYWRIFDGLVLLVVCGAAVGICTHTL